MFAVLDLVDDPADRARDDRPRLPHRLGDGQPEALGEALLDDDGGVALQRVHDRGRLVGVGHRRAGEVDAAARLVRQRAPAVDAVVVDLGRLGIVRDAGDRRAGEDEVRAERGIDVMRQSPP